MIKNAKIETKFQRVTVWYLLFYIDGSAVGSQLGFCFARIRCNTMASSTDNNEKKMLVRAHFTTSSW
jgi:hypothetical protein